MVSKALLKDYFHVETATGASEVEPVEGRADFGGPRRRLGRLNKGICPGDGSTMLEAIEAGTVEVYRFSPSSAHRRATSRHAASFGNNTFAGLAEATPGEAENMEVEVAPTLPDEGEDEDMKNAAEKRAKATPQKKALKKTKLDPLAVFNPKYRLMDCGGGGACGHNSVAIGASRAKGEKWEGKRFRWERLRSIFATRSNTTDGASGRGKRPSDV